MGLVLAIQANPLCYFYGGDATGSYVKIIGITRHVRVGQCVPANVVERRVDVDENEDGDSRLCGARDGESCRGDCPDSIDLVKTH